MPRLLSQILMRVVIVASIALASLAIGGSYVSYAFDRYPSRPVTIIVPFSAGGSTDLIGRIVADALQRELKQSFVVENRTGAGGVIGITAAAKAASDGYTLLHTPSAFSVIPYTKKINYDPVADFEPVTLTAITNFAVVVNPKSPINSMKDLIDRAKNGEDLTFGSGGIGSANHLFAELLNTMANIRLRHIPYRGTAPGLLGVMQDQVTIYISEMPSALTLIKEGKLKAIAVGSATRLKDLPNVPTVAETVPGYRAVGWQGLLTPSGTSNQIVDQLNAAIGRNMKRPEVASKLKAIGAEPAYGTPAEAREQIRTQLETFKKVASAAGITQGE